LIPLLLLAATLNRPIVPAHAGPNRVDPDVELLAHARSDLSDLRLFDANGREVPYLLIAPASREPRWTDGRVLPVARTKTTSGFELDLDSVFTVDRMRIDGIATPFLKRARLEGSGDRAHWTMLADDATIFDLPDDKLRNIEIAFEPGAYRYLRVTWNDRNSAVVTHVGGASARLHDANTPSEPMRVPLTFRKISSEPQKSRYHITLPGAQLPIAAIEAAVTNGEVFREASVYQPSLEGGRIIPQMLGTSTLKRAERFGGVAADMGVKIQHPSGVDLELVVDDGNNPPLAITSIDARLEPLPWLWFESTDGSPITARYGDAQLSAPRYDLEASRATIAKSTPPPARWEGTGKTASNASAETTTMASFRGAAVDRNDFRYARTIPVAPAGVTKLALDADVLSRSRSIADVRIVDTKNQQVPYIAEYEASPLKLTLKVPERTADGKLSRYTFELPYDTLPEYSRIVFTTSSHVFERGVTLRLAADESHGREATVIGNETWSSSQPEAAPPVLAFSLPHAKKVELVIDEGDNASLPITSATIDIPAVSLRFYNPGSPLTLLYGNARASAPQYDLALLAPRVLGEPARDLTLGATAGAAKEEAALDAKIFWGALAVATIILLAILARLVRSRT